MALQISRINLLIIFFIIISGMLLTRLFYLQIIDNTNLTSQSLSMRIQEVPIEVARGEIIDRNGLSLTNTAQNHTIAVFPRQIDNIEKAASQLAKLTGYEKKIFFDHIMSNTHPFKLNIKVDAVTQDKINRLHIPGIVAVTETVRYGNHSLAAHVTGYINLADNQGVSGIEGMFDDILRGGQPTYVAALVDAGQRIIPGLGYKRLRLANNSEPSNVILTLDKRIQKTVENVMDRHAIKGAVIVIKPSTGEILAMASRPNFDANYLGDYLKQSSSPLLNRAISAYQPGSVFKLVAAAAALEKGIVHPEDQFFDPGYIDVNHLRFRGWDYAKGGRGKLNFTEALAYSSNPVFIKIGLKLGAENLIAYAERLGFGHKTNLNFDGESDGYLPSVESISTGELANLTIGQGKLEATPLQIVSLVATIANDGIKVNPYLVSKVTNADNVVVKSFNPSHGVRVLSKKTAGQMQEMMTSVTRFGTGQAAYIDGAGSAGKTGTAETGRFNSLGQSINHAWFAGYAPLKKPQFAMVVFVEEGMSGGDVAAPIFSEIMKAIIAP